MAMQIPAAGVIRQRSLAQFHGSPKIREKDV
jgi:hypothetical protein